MMNKQWKEYKATEVIELIGGGTPKTTIKDYWDGNINWISIKDFNGKRFVSDTEKTITDEGLNNSSTKLLDKGDIIISARGTVGEIAQLTKPMAFNQSCYGIKAKSGVNNNFLYYSLKYNIEKLKNNTHGSVFNTITRNTFETLYIKTPSYEEQLKISNILLTIDFKIELNNQINEKLEETAKALYKEWFVNFNFPDENGLPYKDNGGQFYETELGEIPVGWIISNIDKEYDVKYGKNLPTKKLLESGYPVFGGNGIIGYYSEYLYKNPQVIISCRGAASGKVQTSLPFSFITNNSLILELRNNSSLNFSYTKEHFTYKEFYDYTTGSAQPQLTIENIKHIKVLVPTERVLYQFEQFTSPIYSEILNNYFENLKLNNIKNLLLNKLMSGQIDVDGLNIDWDKLDKTLKEVE